MHKGLWRFIVTASIVALVLAGCGPARQPSTGAQTGGGEVFMVALPRLIVDLDNEGNPVLFGINAVQLGRFVGSDLSSLRVPPAMVKAMTDTNIQHVEVRQDGDAAVFLVNGKPMPHVGWSDQSLQQASDVAAALGVKNADVYRRLLPLVRRFGLDLVLRFPRAAAAAEIPLANPDQAVKISPSTEAPSAVALMEVKYDAQGVPGIMGISAADLARLGLPLRVRLDPVVLQRLQQNNVQTLEIRNKVDGLYLYLNGNVLPNAIWDDTLLNNATDLYVQVNPNDPNLAIMKLLIPFTSRLDLDVLFYFPVAQGQQPIPTRMHR